MCTPGTMHTSTMYLSAMFVCSLLRKLPGGGQVLPINVSRAHRKAQWMTVELYGDEIWIGPCIVVKTLKGQMGFKDQGPKAWARRVWECGANVGRRFRAGLVAQLGWNRGRDNIKKDDCGWCGGLSIKSQLNRSYKWKDCGPTNWGKNQQQQKHET